MNVRSSIHIAIAGGDQVAPVWVNYKMRRDGGVKLYGVYLEADDTRQRLGLDLMPYLSEDVIRAIGNRLMENMNHA